MRKIRRLTVFVATVLSSLVACLLAAPDAFAMRLLAPDYGLPVTHPAVHHGMDAWEIAVIAVAGGFCLAAAIAGLMRFHARDPQHLPRPLTR